ncbi:MAG: hypothetical protein IKX97_01020 [Erysipelotrichaceae bacterium]|nr:hypothetical protein [Erysipelotrichaceae bacterium]
MIVRRIFHEILSPVSQSVYRGDDVVELVFAQIQSSVVVSAFAVAPSRIVGLVELAAFGEIGDAVRELQGQESCGSDDSRSCAVSRFVYLLLQDFVEFMRLN